MAFGCAIDVGYGSDRRKFLTNAMGIEYKILSPPIAFSLDL